MSAIAHGFIPPTPEMRENALMAMTAQADKPSNSQFAPWKFWLTVIGAILIGLIGMFLSTLYPFPFSDFFRAACEALAIAGFVAATVDKYVKWHLLHEVSWDISKFLIGYQLPPLAQDRIKELMGTALIRHNYTVKYVFTPAGNRMQVQAIVSWDLLNITAVKQDYCQHLQAEEHDQPRIEKMECASSDSEATYKLESGGITFCREHGILEAFGKEIKIKPNKDAGADTYMVSGTIILTTPQEYSDVIAFGAPSTNLTVITNPPEGFEFDAPGADMVTDGQWKYNKFLVSIALTNPI